MAPRSRGVPRPPLPPMPGDAAAVRGQCIRLIVATIITTLPGADEDAVRAVVTTACHPKGPARQIAADLFDEPC